MSELMPAAKAPPDFVVRDDAAGHGPRHARERLGVDADRLRDAAETTRASRRAAGREDRRQ